MAVAFRAAAHAEGNSGTAAVQVPGSVVAGDRLLLFVDRGAVVGQTTPSGWTARSNRSTQSLSSFYYERVAPVGYAGTTVNVTLGSAGKWVIHLVAYSGVDLVEGFASAVRTSSGASIGTPVITTSQAGGWVVDHVCDKGSPVGQDWTPPGSPTRTMRAETYQSGGTGDLSAASADYAPGTADDHGGDTWTNDASVPQAIAWSLSLRPAAVAVVANAGADQEVDPDEPVTLDGTASTPPGGSYLWEQISGETVSLTGDTTDSPSFTAPSVQGGTSIVIRLTYTVDSIPDTDTVTVTVAGSNGGPQLFLNESFEGGTPGTTITASNTSFDSVPAGAGTSVFSTDWAADGTRSARFDGQRTLRKNVPSSDRVWCRWRMRFPAIPTTGHATIWLARQSTTNVADIQHAQNTGAIRLRTGLTLRQTSSGTFGAGDVVEIGVYLDDDGNVGECHLWYGSNIDGATPNEILTTNQYTATGDIDDIAIATATFAEHTPNYFDAVRASIVGMPGPLTDPTPPTVVASIVATPSEGRAWRAVTLNMSGSTGGDTYTVTQTAGPSVPITGTGATRQVVLPPLKEAATLTFQGVHSHSVTGQSDTDTADVDVAMHPYWQADQAGQVTVALRRVQLADVDPPPPEHQAVILAASRRDPHPNTGPGQLASRIALDTALAASVSRPRPMIAGGHGYSGSAFPATFAASSVSADPAQGWTASLLNVKIGSGQWQAGGNGSWDAHITTFVNSVPSNHLLFLTADHEPENDGQPSIADMQWGQQMGHHWCAWQRRIAQRVADLNRPNVHYAVCHMEFTWRTANRNPAHWDISSNGGSMPQYVRDRTIIGPDGYNNITSGGGLNEATDVRFGRTFDYFAARGFSRFAVSEHTFNNNIGQSSSVKANLITNDLAPFIRNRELVYYALYDSDGPAAGTNPWLVEQNELAAFAAICLEHNHGI